MSTIQVGLQLFISIVPWLIGAGLGGGLGYWIARDLRRSIDARPQRRRLFLLVPWRSLIVSLPFLSFFMPMLTGLGLFSGALIVGIFVFIFVAPFTTTTLLNNWFPLPLRIRLASMGRLAAVGAVSVAAATGVIGGFAASSVMLQALQLMDYGQFFGVFFMVFVVALLVDVLFGVVEFVFYRPDQVEKE